MIGQPYVRRYGLGGLGVILVGASVLANLEVLVRLSCAAIGLICLVAALAFPPAEGSGE